MMLVLTDMSTRGQVAYPRGVMAAGPTVVGCGVSLPASWTLVGCMQTTVCCAYYWPNSAWITAVVCGPGIMMMGGVVEEQVDESPAGLLRLAENHVNGILTELENARCPNLTEAILYKALYNRGSRMDGINPLIARLAREKR